MALTNQELKRLAHAGAQARLVELEHERQAILKAFPDLGGGRAAAKAPARRKRRKMTAAQKKAVGARMKKYWAAKRAKGAAKK